MRSLSLLALLGLTSPAWAVPAQFVQQGRLSGPDGTALEGAHDLTFRLYGEASGGASVWEEAQAPVFTAGVYTVTLGSLEPLDTSLLQAYPLWLELEVDGTVLSPRQPLTSAPYAGVAGVAESLAGGSVDAAAVSVGGSEVIASDGRWVGPTPNVDWADLGGVPADLADGDADTLAEISCADRESLVFDAVAGAWGCGVAGEGVLTESEVRRIVEAARVDLASGSTIGGRVPRFTDEPDEDTLAGLSCLDGEIARWDAVAVAWDCSSETGLDAVDVGALVDARGYARADDLTALSGEVAGLGTTLDALAADVASGSADLEALSLTCDTLTGEVADLDGRILVLETGALSVSASLSALAARLSSAEAGITTLAGRLTAAESSASGTASAVSSLSATVSTHTTRLATLESASDADTLAGLSCLDGEVAAWDAIAGMWSCAEDLDTLADLGCTSGQVAKWSGLAWACAADLTLTEAQVDAYAADNGYAAASAVAGLDVRVSNGEGDLSDLTTRVGALETDADTTGGLLASLSSTADALSVAYSSLSSTVSTLASRVTALESLTDTLAAVATSGSWDDLLDVPADLSDGDDDTLAGLGCASGESVQWDGSAWACVPAGGDAILSTAESAGLAPGSSLTVSVGTSAAPVVAQAWVGDSTGAWVPLSLGNATGDAVTRSCTECGNGADGAFSSGTMTSVSMPGGTYNYTSFSLPAGVTLRPTGSSPLIIKSLTPVTIAGTIDVSGVAGSNGTPTGAGTGGTAISGGYNGGTPGAPYYGYGNTCWNGVSGSGPSAGIAANTRNQCTYDGGGSAWTTYTASTNAAQVSYTAWYEVASTAVSNIVGGSGGASSVGVIVTSTGRGGFGYPGGGGAGGGAIVIIAPAVTMVGALRAAGGGAGLNSDGYAYTGTSGAGGSVWLRGASISLTGAITGAGIVRIDAHELSGTAPSGTIRGSTLGLPPLFDLRQSTGGAVTLTNYSASTRAVKLAVTH